MHKTNLGELIFFLILFFAIGYLVFMMFAPFLSPIFFAIVLAVLFAPLNKFFLKLFHDDKPHAALATISAVFVLLVIPLSILGIVLFREAQTMTTQIVTAGGNVAMIDRIILPLEKLFDEFVPPGSLHASALVYVEKTLNWFTDNVGMLFFGTMNIAFDCILIFATLYVLFTQKENIRRSVRSWSPLADEFDSCIVHALARAIASTMQATFGVALAQGTLVGIGFWIFGVPNPALWGAIACFAALIPIVEANLVSLPIALSLIFFGHVSAGVGLLVWSFITIGSVDNFVRPYLIKRGVDIHSFIILLSVFGGLVYFGPMGIIAGPVVIALLFTLLRLYPNVVKGERTLSQIEHV